MKNTADPDPLVVIPDPGAVIPDPTPIQAFDPWSHIPRYDPDLIITITNESALQHHTLFVYFIPD